MADELRDRAIENLGISERFKGRIMSTYPEALKDATTREMLEILYQEIRIVGNRIKNG